VPDLTLSKKPLFPEQTGRLALEEGRTQRPKFGCSTTLMSLKKKRRWVTGSTRYHQRNVVELLQGVHLPALKREGGEHVPARMALGDSDSKGKREMRVQE